MIIEINLDDDYYYKLQGGRVSEISVNHILNSIKNGKVISNITYREKFINDYGVDPKYSDKNKEFFGREYWCPCIISEEYNNCEKNKEKECVNCSRDFWNSKYKKPEQENNND